MIPTQRIKELSEQHREYTAQLLSKMIRVPGFSGREKERCELIVDLCKEAGFDEVRVDGLGSVVGRVGHGPKKLAFDAHIDTVEIGDRSQWVKEPHSGEIADGLVYGLGSSDQLGGAAAMIASGRMLKELGYAGEYSCLLYTSSDLGRKLYQEIAMVEEQHVSQYESLKDTTVTWLEDLLMHEYTECYLYYSCMKTEPNPYIRKLWEQFMVQEISHLHKAKDLLWKYEGKQWQQVIPCGTFPEILCLGSNIEYVRDVLANTVQNTAKRECIVPVCDLPKDYEFFKYHDIVNHDVCQVPSHMVINEYICRNGMDYRYEVCENPIPELRNRCKDNTTVGRVCMDKCNCRCRN